MGTRHAEFTVLFVAISTQVSVPLIQQYGLSNKTVDVIWRSIFDGGDG